MNKWLKYLIVLVVLVGLALAAPKIFSASRSSPVRLETAKPERGHISAKVTASGTVSALVTVQVGSQVSGRVEAIKVDFGSKVKKGEVVATIDQRMFKAALAQSRANRSAAVAALERAKVQAEDAERQWNRTKALSGQKLIAQADADTSEANAKAAVAQVHQAEAGVEQAQAALEQADTNLAYTTIISPIDGVVVSRNIDVGQTVAASFQSPTLFTIAQDLSKMQVDTSVSEADVGRVRAGMVVSFAVDAYPERRFEGVVRQVRDSATTVQNVVTYDAVIDVANPDLLLKPGMTANVAFVWAERDGVLRLPNAALRFRPEPDALALAQRDPKAPAGRAKPAVIPQAKAGERLVWVVKDGKPEAVGVRVGLSDGTWTELLSGPIEEGQALVTEIVVDPSASPQKRPF
ncbi:MAG TPA: efflux RND transporter periplasmic adaptor subunit [Myxococcales bacterium]|jgi:HlyD family secretion protein